MILEHAGDGLNAASITFVYFTHFTVSLISICILVSLNHSTLKLKANDTENTIVLLCLSWSVTPVLMGVIFPCCQTLMCLTELENSLGLGDRLYHSQGNGMGEEILV